MSHLAAMVARALQTASADLEHVVIDVTLSLMKTLGLWNMNGNVSDVKYGASVRAADGRRTVRFGPGRSTDEVGGPRHRVRATWMDRHVDRSVHS
ncbi:hypothetical protein [Curtobacterium sp. VKM Ac-2922]|uniref:hypothetical protein n=1 Tax=Curtobacterium sp. VKM Ac-2922 TaxID=2929475 RepID=UPI001FB46C15|nr:hypothetical protein [Curtobacterium sp. VKM Ac-2922]MCJ1712961.1 hypothetical protein [Curtobacterium sp. VKM Ac-2922]